LVLNMGALLGVHDVKIAQKTLTSKIEKEFLPMAALTN